MSKYHDDPIARKKIDGYLIDNAKTQAGLGTESGKFERDLAKEYWKCLLEHIRNIDPEFAAIVEPQD